METLAFKSTWKHAVLEYRIKEIDPSQDLSRTAITERAISAAKLVKDWKPVREKLMSLHRIDGINTPVAMQAKIGESVSEDVATVKKNMLHDLSDYIERLQTPYFVTLIWQNYLSVLESRRVSLEKADAVNPDAVDIPEMYKLFSEITHTDKQCEELAVIREILIRWKNKTYNIQDNKKDYTYIGEEQPLKYPQDSIHQVYDAELGNCLLHRFRNPAGTQYSAIYNDIGEEVMKTHRETELQMINEFRVRNRNEC